jgi:hypothetical protein
MLVNTFLGSLAAKIAVGIGLATATVTAAGAAGVLPEPAQHAVASVVGATTPFTLPDSTASVAAQATSDIPTTTVTTVAGAKDDDATNDDEPGDDATPKVNHGACVSDAAHTEAEPGTKGKTVSSVARSDCGKTDKGTSTTLPGSSTTSSSTSSTSSTSTTVTTPGAQSANSAKGGANSGSGSSNSGNGSANSGKGNSGKK